MANYTAGSASVDVLPSLKGFHKKLATELKAVNPNVGVNLVPNSGKFKAEMQRITRAQRIKLQVEADTASLAKAEAAIKAAEGRIADAKYSSEIATKKQEIAETRLTETRSKSNAKASQVAAAELKVSQAKRVSASSTNDLRNAEEGLLGARQALAKVKNDIDTRNSVSGVQRLKSALSGIGPDGDKASASLKKLARSGTLVTAAISAVGPASSAILLIGRAAIQASQALALLPGLLAAAGAVAGTLAVGVFGISDAFKQMNKDQAGAAKSTNGLASAQKNLARVQEDSARSREQAEISAARSIRSADESLIASKRSLADAQEAVNRAVRDATEQYQQLAFQARGAVLDERQAVLDLADAKSQLDNARASGADGAALERLQIAYDRQVLTLEQAKDSSRDLAAEQAKANEVGIQGSDAVVSARRAEADATAEVAKAQRDLNETKADAAQSLNDQQIQSERALADALSAVTEAQTSSAGAVDKYNEALNKLSPNARDFVQTVKGLTGDWNDLKNTVQDNLFSGFSKEAKDLAQIYLPVLKSGMGGIATATNGFVKELSAAFQEGKNVLSVKTILSDTAGVVDNLKAGVKPLTSIFLDFAAVGTGVLKDLTSGFGGLAKTWADWVSEARSSGKLKEMMLEGVQSVKDLGMSIYNFGKAAVEILKAVSQGFGGLGTSSDDASGSIRSVSETVLEFVNKNRESFVQLGSSSRDALTILKGAFEGVHAVMQPVYAILKQIIGLFGGSLGTIGAVAGGLYALNKVSLGAISSTVSSFKGKMGDLAAKGEGVGRAMTTAGKAIPLVGIAVAGAAAAFDNAVSSSDELATALAQGGEAAAKAQQTLKEHKGSLTDTSLANKLFGASQEEVNAKLDENRAKLSETERAQQDLTKAQNDLTYAQNKYGEASPEAKRALGIVSAEALNLEDAQKRAAEATKSATQKLQDQKDFILGQANASIRYQQAQSRIIDAQTALTEAVNKYGTGSKQAKDAQLELSSAMLDSVSSAQSLAEKQTANSDSAVQAAGQTDAYNKQLAILATTAGVTLPPEIQKMVDGLTDSDLAAQGLMRTSDNTLVSIQKLPNETKLEFPTDADTAKTHVDNLYESVHKLVGEYGEWAKKYLEIIDLNKKAPVPAPGAPPLIFGSGHATGGLITGPGSGTSDSIPAMLSNGEFVMTAAATSKYLPLLKQLNANRFASGGLVGGSGAQGVAASTDVSGLLALDVTASAATKSLQDLGTEISDRLNKVFASLKDAYSQTVQSILSDTQGLTDAEFQLGSDFEMIWQGIATTVEQSWLSQNTTINALLNALTSIRTALQYTADWATTQWARMREAAAEPVRWVLANPFNAGIIAAWNQLNTDFSLGKSVNPIPIGFATGGYVSGPGTGTSDSIPARLSNGEFVMPAKITKKALPFLEALRSGKAEALQATGYAEGGLVDIHGQQLGAAVAKAVQFAQAQQGKPYIWGGVGPTGYDCSGYMSAITNVLRGEANPYKRVGVAASAPWPGFVPGLSSAFAMGSSPTHTAGTLAGTNVESTGNHVRFGGDAHGADDRQFGVRSSLPFVGGQFVPGGIGGSFLDPAAIAASAFSNAKDLASQASSQFPGNRMADFAGLIASQGVAGVQGKASEALGKALMPTGTGGAGVEQWRGVVLQALARVGQPASLADIVLRRMNQESGGNQFAINNWDINAKNGVPSKGLMQTIDPTFQSYRDPSLPNDVYNPLSNIVASMRYAMSRYGSLAAAYNRAGGYSKGGVVPGSGSGDTAPALLTPGERVLPVSVTRTFDRFVENIATADRMAANAVTRNENGATVTQYVYPAPGHDERAIAADSSRRISFGLRSM